MQIIDPIRHDPRAPFFILICTSLIAASVAWWSMTSGVGVGPDSVMFLSSAESLLAGKGLTPIAYHFTPLFPAGKPLVGLAPTYPLLLALGHLFSANILSEARFLHALLFGLNTFLLGAIVYWSTRKSVIAMLAAVMLFAMSVHVLEQHTIAASEAPFITFTLLTTLMWLLYLQGHRQSFLIAASLSAALAMTTRFVGVTIVLPMLVTMLIYRRRSLMKTLRDCVVMLGFALIPLTAVLLHNRATAGTSTNRTLAFHAIGVENLHSLSDGFAAFLLPFTVRTAVSLALLALCAMCIAGGIVMSLKDYKRGRHENGAMPLFAALFAGTYLIFLLVYNSVADPMVELSARTVLPFYVFAIVFFVTTANSIGHADYRRIAWKVFLILTIAVVGLNARHTAGYVKYRHDHSFGFTNKEWVDSPAIAYVRGLPQGTVIYSNAIDAIFFLTHKEAIRIPAKVDPSTHLSNNTFTSSMSELQTAVMNNQAVVVYFDKVTWRWYLPSRDELEKVYRLPVREQLSDGVVYGSLPH